MSWIDIINAFNHEPVHDISRLIEAARLHQAGEAIPATVNGSGTVLKVTSLILHTLQSRAGSSIMAA